MPGPGSTAYPKPESRKAERARATRQARALVQLVRALCVERDGRCRLAGTPLERQCIGRSEWAHLEDHRRFKTVGQPPEQRHTTAGSLMLCAWHHGWYDRHELSIQSLTEHGADGPLRVCWKHIGVLSVPSGARR